MFLKPILCDFPEGTIISLHPPVTTLKEKSTKKNWLLSVKDTDYFTKRGILILSPYTDREERVIFRGKLFELTLSQPVKYKHKKGSVVRIEDPNSTSNIIKSISSKSKSVLIQNIPEGIKKGKIIIDVGEQNQEIHEFEVSKKYLELATPKMFKHPADSQIWEAKLESQLRYTASQGDFLITVEDASHFPT